jgi:uncharacterized protein YggT (Ycf19 family)
MMMTVRLSSCATTNAYAETMQSKLKRPMLDTFRRKKMQINLTDFSNKEAEIICEIIYEKLCDKGLNPEGFSYVINVEVNDDES